MHCFPIFVIQSKSDIVPNANINNRRKTIWSLKIAMGTPTLQILDTLFLCRDHMFPKQRSYKGSSSPLHSSDPLLSPPLCLWKGLPGSAEVTSNLSSRTHLCRAVSPLTSNLTSGSGPPSFQSFLLNLFLPSPSVSKVPFPDLAQWYSYQS